MNTEPWGYSVTSPVQIWWKTMLMQCQLVSTTHPRTGNGLRVVLVTTTHMWLWMVEQNLRPHYLKPDTHYPFERAVRTARSDASCFLRPFKRPVRTVAGIYGNGPFERPVQTGSMYRQPFERAVRTGVKNSSRLNGPFEQPVQTARSNR